MTVKDLKENIADLPDDMEVILQKDSEGNGYSPLSDLDANCIYIPENTYSGQVYSANSNAEDSCMSEQEWEITLENPRVLVLCPVN
jgi:hypothetical protein